MRTLNRIKSAIILLRQVEKAIVYDEPTTLVFKSGDKDVYVWVGAGSMAKSLVERVIELRRQIDHARKEPT